MGKGGEKIGANLLTQSTGNLKKMWFGVAGAVALFVCVLSNVHSQSVLQFSAHRGAASLFCVSLLGSTHLPAGRGQCCEKNTVFNISLYTFLIPALILGIFYCTNLKYVF